MTSSLTRYQSRASGYTWYWICAYSCLSRLHAHMLTHERTRQAHLLSTRTKHPHASPSVCFSGRDLLQPPAWYSHCARRLPCSRTPPQIAHWVLIWVIFNSLEGQTASPQSFQIKGTNPRAFIHICCFRQITVISWSTWSDIKLVGI